MISQLWALWRLVDAFRWTTILRDVGWTHPELTETQKRDRSVTN